MCILKQSTCNCLRPIRTSRHLLESIRIFVDPKTNWKVYRYRYRYQGPEHEAMMTLSSTGAGAFDRNSPLTFAIQSFDYWLRLRGARARGVCSKWKLSVPEH